MKITASSNELQTAEMNTGLWQDYVKSLSIRKALVLRTCLQFDINLSD